MRASRTGDRAAMLVSRTLLVVALTAGVLTLERAPTVAVSGFVLAVGDALVGGPTVAASPVVRAGGDGFSRSGDGEVVPRGDATTIATRVRGHSPEQVRVPEVEPVGLVLGDRLSVRATVPRPGEVPAVGTVVALPVGVLPIELPGSWQVEAGRYAGQEVALDPEGAVRGVDGRTTGGGFWRLTTPRGAVAPRAVAWAVDSLPVRLALERAPGSWLTAHDSLVLWAMVGELEEELGMRLFRPANPDEVGERAPLADGVRLRVSPAIGTAGRTYLSFAQDGRIGDAVVHVASRDLLADRRVLKHELLHALGFGHTSAWPSLLSRGGFEASATAQDAAHARAWYAVRSAQEAGGVLRVPASRR